jgi:glycosyltransferase involved in cell wall biosynthesis
VFTETPPAPIAPSPTVAYDYLFTVFTPTYNRAHTLTQVYDCLLEQTDRDFEWLIIDDGSTDHTPALVQGWIEEAKLLIHYISQARSGKHVAYNHAAEVARGELLVCLDSDDTCVPHALARFRHYWEAMPTAQQARFSGIDCHCIDIQGQQIGTDYPFDPTDSNYAEMRYRYRVQGEKWGCQRTSVMRQFKFPEALAFPQTHLPESIVWAPMTAHYPARYVNEGLRIYHVDGEADRLSQSNFVRTHPIGLSLVAQTGLDVEIDYFWFHPLAFLKLAANYSRSHCHLGTPFGAQYGRIQSLRGRVLWGVMLPIGIAAWLTDRLSGRVDSHTHPQSAAATAHPSQP